jgi:hypothetical protein
MSSLQPFPPLAYGQFNAWVSVTSAPASAVQALLPTNCSLAAQDVAPQGEHPLVIIAGRQLNVRSRLSNSFQLSYLESGIMIPWVNCVDVAHPSMSLFRASLFLDRDLPIFLGRLLGITKSKAILSQDHFGMDVETENQGASQLIFRARYSPQRKTFVRGASKPWFKAINRVFDQIHVGQALDRGPLPVVCVRCDLNLADAYMRPVDAQFTVDESFCAAKCGTFGVPPIGSDPLGSVQLRARWTMHWLL